MSRLGVNEWIKAGRAAVVLVVVCPFAHLAGVRLQGFGRFLRWQLMRKSMFMSVSLFTIRSK